MRPVALVSACLALLLISACGRLGFDARPLSDSGPLAPDAGSPRPQDSGTPVGEPPIDAGMDTGMGEPQGGAGGGGGGDTGPDADGGDPVDAAVDAGCATSPPLEYCDELPRLPAPEPVIDGVLDCGPALREIIALGWTGSPAPLPQQRARMAAAWYPEGLYVYVEVDDDSIMNAEPDTDLWCADGVEIYADSDGSFASDLYDDPGTMQLLAAAPVDGQPTMSGKRWRNVAPNPLEVGDWDGTDHISVVRPGGYAFEAKVTAADLGLTDPLALAPGGTVGLNVAVNVSIGVGAAMGNEMGCPRRLGQYFLWAIDGGCTAKECLPFTTTAAFCKPMLLP